MGDRPIEKRRRVIPTRIAISIILILAIFSCIFLYASYRTQRRQLVDLKESLGESLILSLNETIDFATLLNPLALERIVDNYGGAEGVDEILVMDLNFEIQASKSEDQIGKIWSSPWVEELNNTKALISVQGRNYLAFATPVIEGQEKIGYVALTLSTLKEEQAINAFLLRMMSLVVFALVVCVFLSLWIAKRISDPIHKLEEGANRLSKGELDLKIDIESNDEIGDLAQSFNQMAANLKKSYENLQSNIEGLRQALGSYSEVLSKVALGDLTARVDTEKLKEEYKLLGDTLNSIVTILEWDTGELKKRDAEFQEALTLYGYTLEKIVDEGNLSIRIDTDKLAGKYKLIGADINYLVSNLQTKIEESKKRKEPKKHQSAKHKQSQK
jgi:HAMP domain-containing protein